MAEIVRDASGETFELRAPRPDDLTSTAHMPFRDAVARLRSAMSVVQRQDNHEAMARALAEVGVLDYGTASNRPFDELAERTQSALSDGVLCLVVAVRSLRPVCDYLPVFESEPLVGDEPIEPMAAPADEPEPDAWPGDAAAQAQVLADASEMGRPFCEVCEQSRAASA